MSAELTGYELVIACTHCRKEMLFSGERDILAAGEFCSVRADRGAYRVEFDLVCAECSHSTSGSVRIVSRRLAADLAADLSDETVRGAMSVAGWPG